MFTSFNSIPLYTAHSLAEQASLRELLEQLDIDYSVSMVDINAPKGFYPAISPELLLTQSIDYIFYVHKKDFEKAETYLQQHWNWNDELQS